MSERALAGCPAAIGVLVVSAFFRTLHHIRGGRWGGCGFDHLCESRERERCSSGLLPEGKHDGLTCSSPGRGEGRECQEVVVCLCLCV